MIFQKAKVEQAGYIAVRHCWRAQKWHTRTHWGLAALDPSHPGRQIDLAGVGISTGSLPGYALSVTLKNRRLGLRPDSCFFLFVGSETQPTESTHGRAVV